MLWITNNDSVTEYGKALGKGISTVWALNYIIVGSHFPTKTLAIEKWKTLGSMRELLV